MDGDGGIADLGMRDSIEDDDLKRIDEEERRVMKKSDRCYSGEIPVADLVPVLCNFQSAINALSTFLISKVTCSRCKGTSLKEDNIMEILLDIMGNPKLLTDCLDRYFLKELLDGNNMYSCDRCADFVEAHKFLSIKHAPNILVITLKRVEYTCDSLCGKSCCQKNGSERKNISLSVLEHKHNRISDLPEYNYIRYDGGKFYPTGIKGNYDSIGEGLGKGYNINVPLTRVSGQDSDYSAIWDSILIPVAEIFDPEIILVSAGFDAVKGDIGEFNLTPSIFAHLLRKLMRFANGRILLALEGGYGLKTLPKALVGCFRCLLGDDIEVNVRKSIAKETKVGIQQVIARHIKFRPVKLSGRIQGTKFYIPDDVLPMELLYNAADCSGFCSANTGLSLCCVLVLLLQH